ncbi:hypothetical protein ANN_28371 [Periplaneta americana]|uniref:Endonuclease/exonuclease/phosphatase domain-containing protein n=1 Tax=Periplaneta americana TaxID=6978 RepID=A0ABQ8TPH8_PERAM|nr:hypothetical protein ANN_28371 [Periplaneta americana]
MGGDFNCVLDSLECTGSTPKSPALKYIINNFHMTDVWRVTHKTAGFTYHTTKSASRIDRIYVSTDLKNSISSSEIVPAPFTDHNALIVLIKIPISFITRGRTLWKLNSQLLRDITIKEDFTIEWQKWIRKQAQYVTETNWWDGYVKKKKISTFFKYRGLERKRNENTTLNFLLQCIRDLQSPDFQYAPMQAKLSYIKAQIRTIYRRRMERTTVTSKIISAEEEDKMNIFHLVKERKRCNSHFVTKIEDEKTEYSKQKDIITIFHRYFTDMFDDKSAHVSQTFNPNPIRYVTPEQNKQLNAPITKEEVQIAVFQGKANKSPGTDGITNEFYQQYWDILGNEFTHVLNEIVQKGELCPSRRQGIMALIKIDSTSQNS